MSATLATVQAILKTLYKKGAVAKILYENMPFLGMVKKNTGYCGDSLKIPVIDGGNNGASRTFSVAQDISNLNTSGNKYDAFFVTTRDDYAIGTITRKAMLASDRDEGAFLRALKAEKDGTLYAIKRSLGIALWGNGGGAYGRILAISTTTIANDTITLTDVEQIRYFERGMFTDFSTVDGTGAGAIDPVVTQPRILKINRTLGTLQYNVDLTVAVPTIAVNDFIFRQGDFLAGGGKIQGVPAWIPVTDPTATLFNGVDRSVDTTRLAGIRVPVSNLPILEALQFAGAQAYREGASPDTWFVHPTQMHKLQIALNSQSMVIVGKSSDMPEIGYKGLYITTSSGTARVLADPDMPHFSAWGMSMDSWTLHSMKEAPHLVDEDGLPMLRQNAADGFEWRLSYFANLACDAPGMNVVVTGLGA